MLRTSLATNTYGLTAIVSAWAYLLGHIGIGTFKYAAYLGVMAINAMVFNQYSPEPGSHGSAQFYAARVCDYAIGISLAWLCQLRAPR